MPVVPMKQDIIIERGETINDYGKTIPDQIIEHKARVDEGTFLVEYRASSNVTSKEVVAKAKILLDKLQDVRYEDTISYTNELNETIKGKPKKINVRRHLSGKPILTEVFI
ncbi:hypothetical protein [Ornithinibacillus sp. JPR2-1]|uniref:hypothetical protein n=1 Tax=Ornithinibacillus sp. JPR2-1 TaxID=2094019 RepID=UPI0031D1EE51